MKLSKWLSDMYSMPLPIMWLARLERWCLNGLLTPLPPLPPPRETRQQIEDRVRAEVQKEMWSRQTTILGKTYELAPEFDGFYGAVSGTFIMPEDSYTPPIYQDDPVGVVLNEKDEDGVVQVKLSNYIDNMAVALHSDVNEAPLLPPMIISEERPPVKPPITTRGIG